MLLHSLSARGGSLVTVGGGSYQTITISGTGYGTKTTAAPVFYQPFSTTSTGGTWEDAGFDFVGGGHATDYPENQILMNSSAPGGLGVWSQNFTLGADEWFTEIGMRLPASNSELYASYWVKLHLTSDGNTDIIQYKGIRGGPWNTDANTSYATNPRMYMAIFADNAGQSAGNCAAMYFQAGGSEQATYEGADTINLYDNNWHHIEAYYKLNDNGSSNGIQQIRIDGGALRHDITNRQVRTAADQYFDYIMFCPCPTADAGAYNESWECSFAHPYADNSRARAVLGNNTVMNSCTGGFYPVELTSWSDTQVVGRVYGTIPTGYDYVHIVETDGTINNNQSYVLA